MKFVVSSSSLLSSLTAAGKAVAPKAIIPILENILLYANEGSLSAIASDKEVTIEYKLDVENVKEEGKFIIPPKLVDILKEFPDIPLNFNTDDGKNQITIKSERGKYEFMVESAEDYPLDVVRCGELENPIVLNTTCNVLLEGITRTEYAMATDDLRPAMSSIYIDMNEECFTFVASDAHKLVCFKRFDAKSDKPTSLLLPKKATSILKNLLLKDDTPLKITYNDKRAIFEFGEIKMMCTLTEGKFPNYSAVIPKDNPRKVVVATKDLHNVLRRAAAVTNPASGLIKIELQAGGMVISAQDSDYNMSGSESVSCQYDGDPLAIGFKAKFILETISNINSENTIIELSDQDRPGLFIPNEPESQNGDLLMLLMPMMI